MADKCRITSSGVLAVTQEFKTGTHLGLDFTDYVGGAHVCGWLVAHSDGIVVGVENEINWTDISSSSYGNYVLIEHDGGYRTMYAHCAYHTVQVTKGQKVKKGQRIAYIGNTGQSAGAHCHFEVRKKDGTKIDPYPYINADLPCVSVKYAAQITQGWLPSVTTEDDDFAGLLGKTIQSIKLSINKRAVYIKVHYLNGKWSKAVKATSADKTIGGKPIDAVIVYISDITAKKYNVAIKTRVHLKGGAWLPYVDGANRSTVYDTGFAGVLGREIDGIQIKFE